MSSTPRAHLLVRHRFYGGPLFYPEILGLMRKLEGIRYLNPWQGTQRLFGLGENEWIAFKGFCSTLDLIGYCEKRILALISEGK